MDADAINQLLQKALDQANAKAEQKLEQRLTALREDESESYRRRRSPPVAPAARVGPLRLAVGCCPGIRVLTEQAERALRSLFLSYPMDSDLRNRRS